MIHVKKFRLAAAFILIAVTLIFSGLTTRAAAADINSAAGIVTVSYGSLNVRSDASSAGAILTKLPKGTYVTLLRKTGNWWCVEYAPSCYGYVSADYIKYMYGTYAVMVSPSVSALNVRSGPGTSYPIRGVVPGGRTVLVLSENGAWDRILCNGSQTGYVSASYLKSMMAWPVPASHKINQYFGTHRGIDIGASVHGVPGDAVIAAQQGKVVYAGWLNGYGYVVYINSVYNGQPVQTRYGHLSGTPLVSAGQTVGIGQRIGYMGRTGTSSGVHLHFEVRIRNSFADAIANADSTAVNPLNYVK